MSQPTTSTSEPWSAAIWLSSSASNRAAASDRKRDPEEAAARVVPADDRLVSPLSGDALEQLGLAVGRPELHVRLGHHQKVRLLERRAFGQVDDSAGGRKRVHRRGERRQIVGDTVADGAVVLRIDDGHDRERRPGGAGLSSGPRPAPPPVPAPPMPPVPAAPPVPEPPPCPAAPPAPAPPPVAALPLVAVVPPIPERPSVPALPPPVPALPPPVPAPPPTPAVGGRTSCGSTSFTSTPPSPTRWARTSTTRRSSRASTSRR